MVVSETHPGLFSSKQRVIDYGDSCKFYANKVKGCAGAG